MHTHNTHPQPTPFLGKESPFQPRLSSRASDERRQLARNFHAAFDLAAVALNGLWQKYARRREARLAVAGTKVAVAAIAPCV
eukprot:851810-Amorphochlora_amoeboformis.AAC.1